MTLIAATAIALLVQCDVRKEQITESSPWKLEWSCIVLITYTYLYNLVFVNLYKPGM